LYVFLSKGEQSETGQEAPIAIDNIPQDTSDIETDKTQPKSHDRSSMMNFAVQVVANMFELDDDQVPIDKDGDICVPSGSALVFISVIEDTAYRLFSILLSGVTESYELYRVLNEINCNLNIGRIFFINDQIILEHSIMLQSANQGDFATCISVLTSLADHYDDKLQERFGGKLFLRERADDEIEV
jgi:hypothetical protein